MARLTVTQLRHACVDPAWLTAWLADPSVAVPPPPRSEGGFGYGAVFHRIPEDFVRWLADPAHAAEADALDGPLALWQACWDHGAAARIADFARAQSPAAAQALVRSVRLWCEALGAERLAAGVPWSGLLLTQEFALEGIALPTAAGPVLVSGRPDSVRRTGGGGLQVVDYKTSAGASLQHDLLQIAIYSELLSRARPGLEFGGRLEYYKPALRVLERSAAESRELFQAVVQPVLERVAAAGVGQVGEVGDERKMEAEVVETGPPDLAPRIIAALESFGVKVAVSGRQEAPQLVRYHLKPAPGVTFRRVQSHAVNLRIQLGLQQEPLISHGPGSVFMDVLRDRPETVPWSQVAGLPAVAGHASPLAFVAGVGVRGEPIVCDLCDSNQAHALVAGAAGSGKSEFLKSALASLLRRNTPASLQITLIDPKRVTFGGIRESPFLAGPVIFDLAEARERLARAADDMDQRYDQLLAENLVKLSDRWLEGRFDIPHHVIVMDEFADFMAGDDKAARNDFERLASRLAAKGRAAGVHLILATQRPDRNVVTGGLRANLPLKFCLRVSTTVNSQIVLDEPGAEALLGRGDLFCQRGSGTERAQSPFLPQDEFLALWKGASLRSEGRDPNRE